jgi:hypothetical protein
MLKNIAGQSNYLNFQKTIKLTVFNYGLSLSSGTVDRKSFLGRTGLPNSSMPILVVR